MAQTRIAPPAARAEGQWAFDQKEPLNGNELFKQQDDALNVRQRIEDVYSREGFASIAACSFDHVGRPAAAITVTFRRDSRAEDEWPSIATRAREASAELTRRLSGHAPE